MSRTLFDKLWSDHTVCEPPGEPTLLYIDLHLVHEVTSPQAFDGLRVAGRRVRRPDLTVATADHNVPTTNRSLPITDEIAARQIAALRRNCAEFNIPFYDLDSAEQGIVHVIGPELGLTQPGMTIVCGDSHTSTHGAFGALAFGIGTSEVEHVLATQCIVQSRPRTMEVRFSGTPSAGVTAKDLVLALIRRIGTAGASYDASVHIDAAVLGPQVTWGTSPGMTADITERVPDPADAPSEADRQSYQRALEYMDLRPGTPLEGLKVDRVFLGSCTNARIEDLREAAKLARGRKVAGGVRAMVVPGSQRVKAQAEQEGLDRIFMDAGFEWRNPGCSMCLGMNDDILGPGERCASTSNRNFEGRQGRGGRTHLVSPVMAVVAAVEGCLVDVRSYMRG